MATELRQLEQVQLELKPLNEVRYWISRVLGPEQAEVLGKAEGKQSAVEKLHTKQKETERTKEKSQSQNNQNRGR